MINRSWEGGKVNERTSIDELSDIGVQYVSWSSTTSPREDNNDDDGGAILAFAILWSACRTW